MFYKWMMSIFGILLSTTELCLVILLLVEFTNTTLIELADRGVRLENVSGFLVCSVATYRILFCCCVDV